MRITRAPFPLALLFLFALGAPTLSVRADDDVANEFRQTVSLQHPIKDHLTGFSQLEYRDNPEEDYQTFMVLWPGLTYSVRPWLQLGGGLTTLYTDNEHGADKLELRPFASVKLFVPNKIEWNFYSYTRYQYRDTQDLDTHDWTAYHRIRNRLGVEIPLTSREKAWQSKTWYGLADAEPIYRFDHDTIDPVYVRGGFGYVLNDRVRLEFVYYAEFSRPTGGGSSEHTENIFQLNIKIGMAKGLLRRLRNPQADD